jgi:hypothetical protein
LDSVPSTATPLVTSTPPPASAINAASPVALVTPAPTPQQIADETVKAQQILAAKGLDDSLDDITTAMKEISTVKAHVAYKEALASYIVLREGGAAKG